MSYRILTKNGIDNSNIDGARGEYFNSGMRDGIVQGVLNEGTFIASSSNVISLDTCELRIAGHRIVIDEPVYHTFSNAPRTDTRYAFVAQIIVGSDQSVEFSLFVQAASTPLIQNDLYKTISGAGTYQVEIGRFTLTQSLLIEDVVRTIDVITGGTGGNSGDYIKIGQVTTTTTASGTMANVDIENVERQGEMQTDFNFDIPAPIGTAVVVNGEEQESVSFKSDPQTQINQLSNPNLLINGDFRVNQRGQEEYGNATQYTVDRWQLSTQTNANISFNATTKTLSNTGTTNGYFIQSIEPNDVDKIWGKTWTASVKVNGNVYSMTFTAPDTAPTTSQGLSNTLVCVPNVCNVRLFYYANNGTLGFTFDIRQGSVTIEYAKLELGSVATPFSPRPYAEELAMCQRYYQVIKVVGGSGTVANIGVPRNTTTLRFYINLLSQMRTIPTTGVKSSDVSIINLNTGATTQIDNNSLTLQSETTNMVALNYITTGLTLGHIYNLTDNNGKLRIELDAEIY